MDFSDRIAVEEAFPLGCYVRFNDLSQEVGQVRGYSQNAHETVLSVFPVDGREILWQWHPGNVTKVRRVDIWEPVEWP